MSYGVWFLDIPGNFLLPKPGFPAVEEASFQFSYLTFPFKAFLGEPGEGLSYSGHRSPGPKGCRAWLSQMSFIFQIGFGEFSDGGS